MKSIQYFILLFVGTLFISQCTPSESGGVSSEIVNNPKSAATAEEQPAPVMQFDSLVKQFGTITQGETIERVFTFTNEGDADLIMTSARGSCGCTVPTWPREPIAPGESGEIEVVFNSEGKKGTQHKNIYIIANTTPAKNTITIRGKVLTPANEE